ncbi:MAG TPA: ATP-grasp domain-containing protein [Chryseosolibacter sp.]
MKPLNILFLGGAKRVSLAESFIQSGREHGFNVSIFSYEMDKNVPISFIGKIIIGKRWSAPDVLEHIEETVIRENIHIVLASVDPGTVVAANFKKYTKTNCFVPTPDTDLCTIFFHKQLTYDWALKNNIPVPGADIRFPMIAKPVNGSASVGICKLPDQKAFEEFKATHTLSAYNLQQFIDGIEYSVDCYVSARTGKMIVAVPRIRLEVLGGESIKSVTVRDENIIDLSRQLIEKSGLIGPLTIQFIQDKLTKTNYLMEVNPRFGGAVMCSIGAGADIPGMLIRDWIGENLAEENSIWKSNILMVRRFTEFYREYNP